MNVSNESIVFLIGFSIDSIIADNERVVHTALEAEGRCCFKQTSNGLINGQLLACLKMGNSNSGSYIAVSASWAVDCSAKRSFEARICDE